MELILILWRWKTMSRFDIKLKKMVHLPLNSWMPAIAWIWKWWYLVFGKFDTSPEESLSPQTSMAAV